MFLNSLWGVSLVAMIGITGAAMMKIAGPSVEMHFFKPVNGLVFDKFKCVGDDLIAYGALDKAKWPDGREARFMGMNLMSDEAISERLSWRRTDPNDKSPESREAGLQSIDIYVVGGCGVPFYAYTRHESPWTGLVLPMKFGPFQKGRVTALEG